MTQFSNFSTKTFFFQFSCDYLTPKPQKYKGKGVQIHRIYPYPNTSVQKNTTVPVHKQIFHRHTAQRITCATKASCPGQLEDYTHQQIECAQV